MTNWERDREEQGGRGGLLPLPQVTNWQDFSKQTSEAAAKGGAGQGGAAHAHSLAPSPQGLASAPPNAEVTRPFCPWPRLSLHSLPGEKGPGLGEQRILRTDGSPGIHQTPQGGELRALKAGGEWTDERSRWVQEKGEGAEPGQLGGEVDRLAELCGGETSRRRGPWELEAWGLGFQRLQKGVRGGGRAETGSCRSGVGWAEMGPEEGGRGWGRAGVLRL